MTPDMRAETWLGAAGCASGSHTWRGITPAFPAKPAVRIEAEPEAAERNEPVHGDGEGAPRDSAEPQDERDEPECGGDEPAGRRHQRRRPITSRMAPRIAAGEGGQPGTTASTGTTASAPPTIA